jgi:hypothetical protein
VPAHTVLDFDATDNPLHGAQEGAFFHGFASTVICRCIALAVTLFDENSGIRFYVHKIGIRVSQRNQNRPRPNSLIYIFNSNNVAVCVLHPVSRLEFISPHPTLSLIHSFSPASGGGKTRSSLTANLQREARKAWSKPASFAITLVWRAIGYECEARRGLAELDDIATAQIAPLLGEPCSCSVLVRDLAAFLRDRSRIWSY